MLVFDSNFLLKVIVVTITCHNAPFLKRALRNCLNGMER